jgi:hypothetical protein
LPRRFAPRNDRKKGVKKSNMRKTLPIFILLIVITTLLMGCSSAPASSTTTQTTPVKITETLPAPAGATLLNTVTVTDPNNDLFNILGEPVAAEPYLDIVEAQILKYDLYYIIKIKVNGDLPTTLDNESIVIEWEFFIDTDRNAATGWNSPLVFNDISPDYDIRLYLAKSHYIASIYNISTDTSEVIEYAINGDTIELLVNKIPEQPEIFNYIAVVRKYGNHGAPTALLAADKAPDNGHAQYIEP